MFLTSRKKDLAEQTFESSDQIDMHRCTVHDSEGLTVVVASHDRRVLDWADSLIETKEGKFNSSQ